MAAPAAVAQDRAAVLTTYADIAEAGLEDSATTARALQGWVGVSQDGSLSTSDIKALQKKVGAAQDGKIGAETTGKLRAAMGLKGNGVWDFRTSYGTVKALQQHLNG